MLMPWAIDEMKNVDLKDKRLNDRLTAVLSHLGGHPTASVPAACGGNSEMTAAYRLFDNEKVCFDNVLEPHIEATQRRTGSPSPKNREIAQKLRPIRIPTTTAV